jgi:hypothetical protein
VRGIDCVRKDKGSPVNELPVSRAQSEGSPEEDEEDSFDGEPTMKRDAAPSSSSATGVYDESVDGFEVDEERDVISRRKAADGFLAA